MDEFQDCGFTEELFADNVDFSCIKPLFFLGYNIRVRVKGGVAVADISDGTSSWFASSTTPVEEWKDAVAETKQKLMAEFDL